MFLLVCFAVSMITTNLSVCSVNRLQYRGGQRSGSSNRQVVNISNFKLLNKMFLNLEIPFPQHATQRLVALGLRDLQIHVTPKKTLSTS